MRNYLKNNKMTSVYEPVEFELPDARKYIDELELESKAKISGRRDIPASDSAEGNDSNELNIKHFFRNEVDQATLRVTESSLKLQSVILNTSLDKEIAELQQLESSFREQANVESSRFQSEIEDAKSDFLLLDNDLSSFKRENRLKREAIYPASHVFSVALLLLVLVVESVLNSYFFAQANDFGLVGGFLQATIISVCNLLLGLMIGIICLRNINHIRTNRSVMGWFGLAIFGVIALIFNLFVAHFRTALSTNPDDAGLKAVETFTLSPLGVTDFDSWILFLIGTFVVVLASLKSYRFDDVYPGYGKLSRQALQAREHLRDLQIDWAESLKEHYEDVMESMERFYETCDTKAKNLTMYHNYLVQQKALLDRYTASLSLAMEQCIVFYRDQNKQYRKTPAPSYFREAVNGTLSSNFTIEQIESRRDQILEDVRSVARQLPEIKNAISRVYQEQTSKNEKSVAI